VVGQVRVGSEERALPGRQAPRARHGSRHPQRRDPARSWSPRRAGASCLRIPAVPPTRSGSSERRRWCPTSTRRCAASTSTPSRWKAPGPQRSTGNPAPSTACSSST